LPHSFALNSPCAAWQAAAVADVEALDVDQHCGAVYLGALATLTSPEAAIDRNRQAFLAAIKLAPRLTERGGVFVTVQDTSGDFGLGRRRSRSGLRRRAARAR
jgi:hypothetical protein